MTNSSPPCSAGRNARYDILFEPVQLGPVRAGNRFFQVPHCNGMGYRDPARRITGSGAPPVRRGGSYGEAHHASAATRRPANPAADQRLLPGKPARPAMRTAATAQHRGNSSSAAPSSSLVRRYSCHLMAARRPAGRYPWSANQRADSSIASRAGRET